METNIYKEHCIGPYSEGDIIEVLVGDDDGSKIYPETQYYIVKDVYMELLAIREGNTTGECFAIVPWGSTTKYYYGEMVRSKGNYGAQFVVEDRKIDTRTTIGTYITLPREEILFNYS